MESLGKPIELSSPEEARAARKELRAQAATVITDPDILNNVELLGGEAVANALLHGTGVVTITAASDQKRLHVEVTDEGPARATTGRVDNGRGLNIISALATRWELGYKPGTTCLTFEVDL